jgi:signal transduction histidine kinase
LSAAAPETAPPPRWRPRLRSVLLAVSLLILSLPLVGIFVLRLYENELVRRTESELLGQGAIIRALVHESLRRRLAADPTADPETLGNPIVRAVDQSRSARPQNPPPPQIDLASDPILPAAPNAVPHAGPSTPEEAVFFEVGAAISPVMVEAQATTLAGMRVVDPRGVVVATTRGELGMSLADREEVVRALRGERVSLLCRRVSDEPPPPFGSIARRAEVRVFVALPIIDGERVWGAVVLSRTPVSLSEALFANRRVIVLLAAALLVVVLLVSTITAVTISRPVEALTAQAARVAAGDFDAATPLARPGTLELDQLSRAFAATARTLAARAEYIRTFASNVSHGFKAPLTSIRGAVELFRDHLDEMSAEERERFLAIVDGDAERLERLVNRLHDLARADVARPGELGADAHAVAEALAASYRERGARVTVQGALGGRLVAMAPETLESVLVNLVDNALEHGGSGVSVRVELALRDATALLAVHDDGPGVSRGNSAKIFDAFFTTAKERGGTGLGLSIVRTLVEAHGGRVGLHPVEAGARFVVELPTRTREER